MKFLSLEMLITASNRKQSKPKILSALQAKENTTVSGFSCRGERAPVGQLHKKEKTRKYSGFRVVSRGCSSTGRWSLSEGSGLGGLLSALTDKCSSHVRALLTNREFAYFLSLTYSCVSAVHHGMMPSSTGSHLIPVHKS